MKERYVAPRVRKIVEMELEEDILLGSVVNQSTHIDTAGQTVENHSFEDSGFDAKWE